MGARAVMEKATFARRLRVALAHDGRDDKDVAAAAGVAQDQLSRWKTGASLPRIGSVASLVEALEISGHWLLTGEGSMQPTDPERDALKLDVIGMVYNEEVDILALKQFAEDARAIERDDVGSQVGTAGLGRGPGGKSQSPDESDGPGRPGPRGDHPTDDENGPPDEKRREGP